MAMRWLRSAHRNAIARLDGRDAAREPLFDPEATTCEGAELVQPRHAATITEVFQRYPEVLSEVTAYVGRPEEVLRNMRLWSPSFLQFCTEEPAVAAPLERLTNTVTSSRAVIRSDRRRCGRLLLSGLWVLLFGLVAPVYTAIWVFHCRPMTHHWNSRLEVYRIVVGAVAGVSTLVALLLPAKRSEESDTELQQAVVQLAEMPHRSHLTGRLMPAANAEEASTQAADSHYSISASTAFVRAMKYGMLVSSLLGLLVVFCPLAGLCASCFALLLTALSWGRFAGYDLKLSVLKMFQPERRGSFGGSNREMPWEQEHALMRAQWLEDERLAEERLGSLPANTRQDAVRAVTSTCFCICAFRSLVLWVSAIRGCSVVEQELHDPACFPSLVAMLCPGFLVLASLLRLGMAQRGCCDAVDGCCYDAAQGEPRLRCYIASGIYLCLPLWALNLAAFLLALRWLADVSKTPLAAFGWFQWRVPFVQQVLVLASVVALWLALLMFSTIISACTRILSDSAVCGFGMLSSAYLIMEVLLAMLVFNEGKTFLPEILMMSSTASTGVLALVSIGYVIYTVSRFASAQPSRRSQEPLLFLWG